MWYTITGQKDNESIKIVSNWQGVVAFLRLNLAAEDYSEVSNWIYNCFANGEALTGWQWANGDYVEVYCPSNEPAPIEYPVAVNPLRKLAHLVSTIL